MGQGDSAGGSLSLAGLLDEHGEAITADLLRYYGVDIRDLFDQESDATPRWVLVLIRQLPLESSFAASCQGGAEYRGWDESRYLMADLVDLMNKLSYMFESVNSKKKPQVPEPVYRPGMKKRSQETNQFTSIASSMLAEARSKKGVG